MSALNNIINIIASQTGNKQNEHPTKKHICIVIDVSGSTGSQFLPGIKILEKEIEIAEQYILANPDDKYTVIAFDDKVNTYKIEILKEEMMTNIHSLGLRSGGSTYTDRAFNEVLHMTVKPTHVVLLTDGQTNSNSSTLETHMHGFSRNNITLEVIAVSETNVDMSTLTQREEQRIPGMDLINYLGNSISKLTIYNKMHRDIPYIGAFSSTIGKNCITFMEVPVTGFIPDFIRSIVSEIKNHEIDWGANQMNYKKFLSEIGKLLSALFVSFPESNVFIENIVNKLTELNVSDMTPERIRNIIKYGFDCTRSKKPIIYTNFEERVKESVVKKAEFADAIAQLKSQGTTLGATTSISMPSNGTIIINNNAIQLNTFLGTYPKSGDMFQNYYFGLGENPQAIRIALREFCGFLGIKNHIASHSVIFYIANQMSLLYIKNNEIDSDVMKYYRELATYQTSLETLVSANKYSGIGCYEQWKNGMLPQMHFSSPKTHTSLYTDTFINPLRLNEPLWWALMMSMLGLFNKQLPVYEEAIKGLQIEPTETEFLKWVSDTFRNVVDGHIQIVNINLQPTSIFTLSEFEAEDQVFVLKNHGNCKTNTHYSKLEIDEYVMRPDKGCVWCHYQPSIDDFVRVTLENPIEKIKRAKMTAVPLTVNAQKLKDLNLSPNISILNLSLNTFGNGISSIKSECRLIRINMIGITGSGKSTFSKRISEIIAEKGGKCVILNTDKWAKRNKKGKELYKYIISDMNELNISTCKLKVVIVDICNEKGISPQPFNIDFSNYETFNIVPNMIKEKFNQYEAWCLRNVLNRPIFTDDSLYWLNPVSAGVNTCIKVHNLKAKGVVNSYNIPSSARNFNEKLTLEQALELIENDANAYDEELKKTSIDNDINKFVTTINI